MGMETHWQFWLQAIIASASIIAALAAAFAAWRGPIEAAKLTIKVQDESKLYAQKMTILGNLMQYRYDYLHDNFAGALNLIDLVFSDSLNVRDKWSKFHVAIRNPSLDSKEGFVIKREKLTYLIEAIASDMGLQDKLRSDDFDRLFYPRSAFPPDIASTDKTKN